MSATKTLNNYLFDQLERLSEAKDPETIKIEVQKATAIVSVSEQILNVSRLKLDILQANKQIADGFKEIDDNAEADKKKLNS